MKGAQLFEAWLACDGKWSTSSFLQTLKRTREHATKGCWRWFTRRQLVEKYNESIADAIISNKMSDPKLKEEQVRRHPDCPERDDSQLQYDIMMFDVHRK